MATARATATAASQAPFPNVYQVKHVAASSARACVLCFKPSATVLITANAKDWFYVCDMHLRDAQFAQTTYRDASGADVSLRRGPLLAAATRAEQNLEKARRVKSEKSASWALWAKKEDPKKEETPDPTPDLELDLKEAQTALETFDKTNTRYKLDAVFYKRRLLEDFQRQRQRETMRKMEEGTLFPTVAPGAPGVAPGPESDC